MPHAGLREVRREASRSFRCQRLPPPVAAVVVVVVLVVEVVAVGITHEEAILEVFITVMAIMLIVIIAVVSVVWLYGLGLLVYGGCKVGSGLM